MQFDYHPLRLRRISRCPQKRTQNVLFRAALSDNLEELKHLVEANNSVNIQNTSGFSLLGVIMKRRQVDFFNYLLSLDDTDVNFLDRWGQTPLIYLVGSCFDEYFAQELVKKGADIDCKDDCGFSLLHLAASDNNSDNLMFGKLLIEKGVDVNCRAQSGVTPLYNACEMGNSDWVCMLLYYGADVTIPSDRGVLPISVVDQQSLQDILFDYTFDKIKIDIKLSTLVATMSSDSNLFPKILDICGVSYDLIDLQHLVSSLIYIKPQHFQLFVDKYGYIIEEMIQNFSPMDVLLRSTYPGSSFKRIFEIFLQSSSVAGFIQNSNISSVIAIFLDCFNDDEVMNEEDITKMICLMLSYGLNVTFVDLHKVYHYFGDCELFRIMLHMDIKMTSDDQDRSSIVTLYIYPGLDVDDLVLDHDLCLLLLDYYNNSRIKEFVLANFTRQELPQKIRKLHKVPHLMELSRNAVRKYIVDKFNIKNSVQFYTVLRWLPIGEMNKSIIGLKKKLYQY